MSLLDEFKLKKGVDSIEDAFLINNDPVDEEILFESDALWREKANTRPPIDLRDCYQECMKFSSGSTNLVLYQGDITTLQVDAIMNAANDSGLGCFRIGHPCIDNAIHRAAGPRLREACRNSLSAEPDRFRSLPVTKTLITEGFFLAAKQIIHVTGPQVIDGKVSTLHSRQLYLSYLNFFYCAVNNKCRSVALCCLSTGQFAFNPTAAAEIAMRATRDFLKSNSDALDLIVFDVFLDSDRLIYEELLPSSFASSLNVAIARNFMRKARKILIVAGAGLSVYPSEKQMNVYVDENDFQRHYPDMPGKGFKTGYETMEIFNSSLSESQRWGFWARHMMNMRYLFPPCEAYSMLKTLCEGKVVFVLTSNVDGCFVRSGFNPDQVYTPQGDWSHYQCMKSPRPCSKNSFWPSRPILDSLLKKVDSQGNLPEELVPKCSNCKSPCFGNVRGSNQFLHTPYDDAQARLIEWIDAIREEEEDDFVIIEIGAGFNTPIICRAPAESIALEKSAPLIRINPDHAELPREIENGVSIASGWNILSEFLTQDDDMSNIENQLPIPVNDATSDQVMNWKAIFASLRRRGE